MEESNRKEKKKKKKPPLIPEEKGSAWFLKSPNAPAQHSAWLFDTKAKHPFVVRDDPLLFMVLGWLFCEEWGAENDILYMQAFVLLHQRK